MWNIILKIFILKNINFQPIEDDEEIRYIQTMLLIEGDEEEGKKEKNLNQNLNSKQTINQTSNIMK